MLEICNVQHVSVVSLMTIKTIYWNLELRDMILHDINVNKIQSTKMAYFHWSITRT